MSQNRLSFSMQFSFATSLSLLKAFKSIVISSATKMKSQHVETKRPKTGNVIGNDALTPAYSENHAKGYPNDVFKSSGNRMENENEISSILNTNSVGLMHSIYTSGKIK